MNWDKFIAYHNATLEGKFCFCGLPAVKIVKSIPLCHKHDKPPVKKQLRGKWSGASKSQNKWNDYN